MEAAAEHLDGVPFMRYPTPLYDSAGQLVGAINMLVDNHRPQTRCGVPAASRISSNLAMMPSSARISMGSSLGTAERRLPKKRREIRRH